MALNEKDQGDQSPRSDVFLLNADLEKQWHGQVSSSRSRSSNHSSSSSSSSTITVCQEKQDLVPVWLKSEDEVAVAKPSALHTHVVNFLCVLLNTVSTVCIVFVNKIIFSDAQFRHFQVATAAWHFTATTLLLLVASGPPFNLFPRVRFPVGEMLPIAALFVGFLVLGNLSLAVNDVSFYQLAKIMTTPTVVALNFVLWKKRISSAALAAIVVSCVGVALTNASLAFANPLGTLVAVSAFVVTAFYQIWIGKKMTDLDASAPQLLLNQAPVSVALLLCLLPFTDTVPDVGRVEPRILATFLFSGVLAAGLNLSQFLIIGRTSALTFNVVSNAKNVIIIVLGWYQVHKVPSRFDVLGISLALGGAYVYAVARK